MGAKHSFCCNICGYTARVSGEPDRGMFIFTETKVCNDCHALVDVTVALAPEVRRVRSLPPDPNIGKCPLCKGENLHGWDGQAAVCPKCNKGKMVREATDAWLWD
jgi:hypothetical protein